jgi:hypothetical protein
LTQLLAESMEDQNNETQQLVLTHLFLIVCIMKMEFRKWKYDKIMKENTICMLVF